MERPTANGIQARRKRGPRAGSMFEILCERELGGLPPCAGRVRERHIYRHVCPKEAAYNVAVPSVYFKRFSPDGKLLVGISRDQACVHTYEFHGSTRKRALRASDMTERSKRCKADGRRMSTHTIYRANRHREADVDYKFEEGRFAQELRVAPPRFSDFFSLKHNTRVIKHSPSAEHRETLNRDFSLFTCDGSYVILASTEPSNSSLREVRRYPCSLVSGISAVERVTFYTVDVRTGNVCGELVLKNDYVHISHHAGVGLHGDMFAVVSVFHQCIRFFQISPTGTFYPVRTIGWFNYEEEPLLLGRFKRLEEMFRSRSQQEQERSSPFLSSSDSLSSDLRPPAPYSGIKQRLLSFLYRRAVAADDGGAAIRYFFRTLAQYSSLIMTRMQFIDEGTILIRFGEESVMIDRNAECTASTVFHMVYSLRTTEVIAFHDNMSLELASLFEQAADRLRGTASGRVRRSLRLCGFDAGTICSNNLHARDALMKVKHTVTNARDGGRFRAARRTLYPLPFSPQSFSSSPYFDHSLFIYDEKVINASEKLKVLSDIPVRFYDRLTGKMRFCLRLGPGSVPRDAVGATPHSSAVPASPIVGWTSQSTSSVLATMGTQGSSFVTAAAALAVSAGSTAESAVAGPTSSPSVTSTSSSTSSQLPMVSASDAGNYVSATSSGETRTFPAHAHPRRLMQCIAHPREPFFMIVVHSLTVPQIVNLHYYEP